MNALLLAILSNLCIVCGLALFLASVQRWIKRADVRHLLWVLLLVKLLTPPVWSPRYAWLPSTAVPVTVNTAPPRLQAVVVPSIDVEPADVAEINSPIVETPTAIRLTPVPALPASPVKSSWFTLPSLLIALWVSGGAFVFARTAHRSWKFARLLKLATPADDRVQRLFTQAAAALKLRRVPRLLCLPVRISPALWGGAGRPAIVLPTALVAKLNDREFESVLLHELVHFARRDHWVRLLELAATTVYWWLPVAWWLRAEVRRAEEEACDDRVLQLLPVERRTYAETLVRAAGFLSLHNSPATATTLGGAGKLEQRVRRIMHSHFPAPTSRRALSAVVVTSLIALPFAPVLIRAQEAGTPPATNSQPAATNAAEEGATVRVVLVDEQDQPVPRMPVAVTLDWKKHPSQIVTDERGEFTVPASWIPGPDEARKRMLSLLVQDGNQRLAWYTFNPKGDRISAGRRVTMRMLACDKVITGRLLSETDEPLAGVPMSIKHIALATDLIEGANLYFTPIICPTSGRDGRFEIPVPENSVLRLYPAHPDRIQGHLEVNSKARDIGEIVLRPAGSIAGIALDATTGAPLSDRHVAAQATDTDSLNALGGRFAVTAMYQATVTDAAGRYELRGLPPGDFNVLFAGDMHSSRLVAPAHDGVIVEAGKVIQADFRARPAVRLFGKVLDEESLPATQLSVGYYGAAYPQSGAAADMVKSNSAGEFEFFVPPGRAYLYFAGGAGGMFDWDWPNSSRELNVPDVVEFGPMNLKVKKSRFGQVQDMPLSSFEAANAPSNVPPPKLPTMQVQFQPSDGSRVRSATVYLFGRTSPQARQKGLLYGATGTYPVTRDDLNKPITLVAVADGFRPAVVPVEPITGEVDLQIVIPLTPAVLIPVQGRIVNHAGQPVAGARIRVRRNLYREEMQFPWGAESLSAADGTFTIDHIQAGDRFQLEVDIDTKKLATTQWYQLEEAPGLAIPEIRLGE